MSEKLAPSLEDKPIESGKVNPLPAGKIVETDPNSWYHLKVNYTDKDGHAAVGYAIAEAKNASTSFWDYVVVGGDGPPSSATLQIQPQTATGGWQFWKIRDNDYNKDYHLDCKATGFLYRTNLYNTWWQIVDGKLYCSYWTTGVPAGIAYYSFLVPTGEYFGMGLPVFTCELVKTS